MRALGYIDRSRSFDAVCRDAPRVHWAVGLRRADGRSTTLVVGWLGIALSTLVAAAWLVWLLTWTL